MFRQLGTQRFPRRIRCGVAGAVLLLAVLSGCGFHLQGRAPLPEVLAVTFIDAEDLQSDFVLGLRRALLASGARLTENRKEATAVVRVHTDEVTERVLSVSARNLPREYELTHTVRFSVTAGEKSLLDEQEVRLSRDFSFDERVLLAKEEEEAILREALARDLVGIVMRRLASL